MSLNKQQFQFTFLIGQLINYAYNNGYTLTFGDAYANHGHKKGSFHYNRLAVDFNLFRNGVYLFETADYLMLGEFWESIGGTWGGRFKNKDGCHFSLGE